MTKEEILAARLSLGWSRAEAARMLGVNVRSIERYEDGTHRVPEPVVRLIRLAETSRAVRRQLKETKA